VKASGAGAKITGAKRGAHALGELLRPALDPLVAKRGLASTDVLAFWPEIVGERFAPVTRPERIRWGRRADEGATLVIRCDPSAILALSFEEDVIRERVNRYLGYAAVVAIRTVARPIEAAETAPEPVPALDAAGMQALDAKLAHVEEPLKGALRALGLAVLGRG